MRRLILPLSFVLAGVFPLLTGWLAAGWLVNRLETAVLKGWVVAMVTAVLMLVGKNTPHFD
jgi:hypothetical protein